MRISVTNVILFRLISKPRIVNAEPTRQAINHANILVFNYQYMLDPKVAKIVSKELEAESIIVFDEAHNIDSVCIEALSVTINDRGLEQATRSLGRLSSEVSRIKQSDNQRLQQEYQNLVDGLIDQGLLETSANDNGLASVSESKEIESTERCPAVLLVAYAMFLLRLLTLLTLRMC